MDPCCGTSLRYNLGKPHPLSKVEVVMLEALMRTATGKALPFDLRRNCSSVAAVRHSRPLRFELPAPAPLYGEARCFEDTTGIPQSAVFTAEVARV